VALALGKGVQNKELSWRELVLGALCSVVPDLDVIGFYVGIQYGDVWDIVVDALGRVCGVVSRDSCGCVVSRQAGASNDGLFLYFFFCTASHGVLDAMTNGGLAWRFSLLLIRRDISFLCDRSSCLQSRQRIFQRIRCSDFGQRSDMDLAAIQRGVRSASRSPADWSASRWHLLHRHREEPLSDRPGRQKK